MKIIGKFPSTRLRRVRNSKWMRRLVSENKLSTSDLIQPIFIRDGNKKIEKIKTMPGINRYSVDKLKTILDRVVKYNIPMVALFPLTPARKKESATICKCQLGIGQGSRPGWLADSLQRQVLQTKPLPAIDSYETISQKETREWMQPSGSFTAE